MLSPTTFIGIANATSPVGKTAPAAAPTHAPASNPGYGRNVQQARILSTPPIAAPIMPMPKSAGAASPTPSATPPRNLPRGSLLDLSV
jgi:hypothetical protein